MKTIIKSIIIAGVFIISLLSLLHVKSAMPSGKTTHSVEFIEKIDDWEKCELANCGIDIDKSSIDLSSSDGRPMIETCPVEAGFKFDQLILSWNIQVGVTRSPIKFQVEVSEDGRKWHRFDYLTWGSKDSKSEDGVKSIDGVGRMAVDVLRLQKPMRYARVIVSCIENHDYKGMYLRRLALSFSNDNPSWAEYGKNHPDHEKIVYNSTRLAVPYTTQRSLEANNSGGACSPTAVSMVLNYYNPGIIANDFAWKAYDNQNEIFGNWPYNIQAAFETGLNKAWIERHCGFDEIYDEISEGKPVVISIAYGYDELSNSPIHAAEQGHLVVVVGFDGPDTVICNDPAGHGVDDGIIKYPREELEKAWIGHTGVAYHLWP